MPITSKINNRLVKTVNTLTAQQQLEVLKFIGYLQTEKNASVTEYINERTRLSILSKKQGKQFTSLKELQKEYAEKI